MNLKQSQAAQAIDSFFLDKDYFDFDSAWSDKLKSSNIMLADANEISRLEEASNNTQIIVILFTNRTGSNLAVDMIASSGMHTITDWEPLLAELIIANVGPSASLSLAEYLADYIKQSQINGYCALKLSWDSLFALVKHGIWQKMARSCRYILCERDNILAQAASYYVATYGNIYLENIDDPLRSNDKSLQEIIKSESEKLSIEIAKILSDLTASRARLRYFLELFSLPFYRAEYLSLTNSYEKERRQILSYVGAPIELTLGLTQYKPSIRKQDNSLSHAIEQAFRGTWNRALYDPD